MTTITRADCKRILKETFAGDEVKMKATIQRCLDQAHSVTNAQADIKATDAIISQVKAGTYKSKVGMAYRRRTNPEKAKLEELNQTAEDIEREQKLCQNEFAKALTNKVKLEADMAQAAFNMDEEFKSSGLRAAFDMTQGIGMISQGLTKVLDMLSAKKEEMDQKLREVADAKMELDTTNAEAWKQANAEIGQERSLDYLFGDIKKTTYWAINPAAGQQSSAIIQMLEQAQRAIENDQPGAVKDYAETDAYFMYSASRECAVKLHKVSARPSKWDYYYYYVASPHAKVVEIFAQCQGKTIAPLPKSSLSVNEFADV